VIASALRPAEPPPLTADAAASAAEPTSDEALIATLPAPGLFRQRREDAPPAARVREESPVAGPGATPTLEALAVELAHQLKNPLVTIKTFVGSIESLRGDPQELGQFRALTDEAVTRMDEILDGLLAFARLRAPFLDTFDVVALLRDALRSTWHVLSSKQVELDAPDDALLRVHADRDHVRFALATLARHVAETIEPRARLAIAVEEPATLRLDYRESGAITHLRGASHDGESGLPLALLLVRGALARIEGDVEIALKSNVVSIRLRLASP
jgi:signal transduction histidine kinase